jgi:hypothetical protein
MKTPLLSDRFGLSFALEHKLGGMIQPNKHVLLDNNELPSYSPVDAELDLRYNYNEYLWHVPGYAPPAHYKTRQQHLEKLLPGSVKVPSAVALGKRKRVNDEEYPPAADTPMQRDESSPRLDLEEEDFFADWTHNAA